MLVGMRVTNVSLTWASTSPGEGESKARAASWSMPQVVAITRAAGTPLPVASPRYAQKLWIEDFVRHAVYLPQKVIERADVAAAAGRNTDVEHTPRWPSPRRTQPRPRRDRPCRSKEDAGPRAGGRGRCLHRSG